MVDKTIAIDIDLSKNENRNEFSYIDLVKTHLGFDADATNANADLSLVDFVKEIERKYGEMLTAVNKTGSKRRLRLHDYKNMGEGYDTRDPFIDDSEAVELVVAPTLRTRHEGFFVNDGLLETVEDSSMDIEAPPKKQARTDRSGTHSPTLLAPQPKRTHIKKDKSKQLLERAVKQLSATSVSASTSGTAAGSKPPKNNDFASLDAVFDSVLAAPSAPESTQFRSAANLFVKPPSGSGVKEVKNPQQTGPQKTNVPAPLPSLSPDVETELKKVLEHMPTSSSQGSGQVKLTPQFEEALFKFDEVLSAKKLSRMQHSAVMAHIASKLGMKGKSLISRLRKIKENKQDKHMDPMLHSLKEAVAKLMPEIIATHQRDFANYQERLSVWEREKLAKPEAKRPGAPKKIFRWNSDCRTLLEKLVTFQMELTFKNTGKCPTEEEMRRFLNNLIPLWPENWISVAALWRAGSSAYLTALNKLNPAAAHAPTATSSANSAIKVPQLSGNVNATISKSSPTAVPARMISTPPTCHVKSSTASVAASVAAATVRLSENRVAVGPLLAASTINTRLTPPTLLSQFPKQTDPASIIDLTRSSPSGGGLRVPTTVSAAHSSPKATSVATASPVATARRVTPLSVGSSANVQRSPTITTVNVGQIFNRQPQQQQSSSMGMSELITATAIALNQHHQNQLARQQQQRLSGHENVRIATSNPVTPVIVSQQRQSLAADPPVAHSAASPLPSSSSNVRVSHQRQHQVWGNNPGGGQPAVSYVTNRTSSAAAAAAAVSSSPTAAAFAAAAAAQQQLLVQQHMRAAFANFGNTGVTNGSSSTGPNKIGETLLALNRQLNLAQGQSNDVHRTTDGNGR